jgi:hypothetical protein
MTDIIHELRGGRTMSTARSIPVLAGVLTTTLALTMGGNATAGEKISGVTKNGPVLSETRMTVEDNAQRVVTMSRRVDKQTNRDPLCPSATVLLVGVSETTSGSGSHHGWQTAECANGDKTFSTYEGVTKVVPNPGGRPDVTWSGTWRLTGGTGSFEGVTGRGTYNGRVTAEGAMSDWEGERELKKK